MPIPFNALPPVRSVYDYPVYLPGQDLTEEQEEQLTMAQIAGIILAVAASKTALKEGITNQLVGVLRMTDLLSKSSTKAFAEIAALLVQSGIEESWSLTWGGVRSRANAVGVDFSEEVPTFENMPRDLRYSRGTDLVTAYERIAKEYQNWVSRDASDPIIAELVEQYENAHTSPIPRPDTLSSDAEVREEFSGEQEWEERFRRSQQESRERTRRAQSEAESTAEERAAARAAAQERREATVARRNAERERRRERLANRETGASSSDSASEAFESGASGTTITRELEVEFPPLEELEVQKIIEQHAEQKAEELLERMVDMDIQAAGRNAQAYAMERMPGDKVRGFRRVLHPELAKSGMSCGLCIVASTVRYTRRELMPIHAGCNCETVEIFVRGNTEFDPGQQINEEDLAVFYDQAGGSTHGWDLKRQRYRVVNHPEYGPTLVNDNESKRGESVQYTDRMGLKIE